MPNDKFTGKRRSTVDDIRAMEVVMKDEQNQGPNPAQSACNGLLSDSMRKTYDEEERNFQEQRDKMGVYDNPENGCPHCGRHRVMQGKDGKHRCEKCFWCIEDNERDSLFFDYIAR